MADSTTTPPARTAEQFIDELKSLVSTNVQGNAQLVARVNELLQQSTRERPPTDAATLFARWLDFNLASYAVVSAHTLGMMNSLVTAAERALLGRAPATVPVTPAPETGKVELHVEGKVGETVRAPFMIENQYDRTLEVAFEASALDDGAGHVVAPTHVAFEPPKLSLARGQRVVQAVIALGKEFTAGRTYHGTIRVLGFQAREIALALTVTNGESEREAEPGKGASHATRSSKRKTPG